MDRTPVYGVSWDHENVYLGERDSKAGGSIERRSPSLKRLGPVKDWVRDVHQVLWADGILYWTNTHEDTLEAWDGHEVMVAYDAGGNGTDAHHLNSVWQDANGHLWIVEHGRGNDASQIRCLNTTWHFGFQGITDLHNVYIEQGHAYVLAGARVLSLCLENKHLEEMVRVPDSYLRGLARDDGRWYVGRSLVGERGEREGHDAHVLVFDDDWKQTDCLTLPKAGQVHEVRLLEGDRAHNGLAYP